MMKEEMEQLLKDYHWMINSVKVIREGMNEVGEGMTADTGWKQPCQKGAAVVQGIRSTGNLTEGKND